jgi:hypothetical protein
MQTITYLTHIFKLRIVLVKKIDEKKSGRVVVMGMDMQGNTMSELQQ